MGIGVSFFTEAVGAGPRKDMDILGLAMADGAELRVHPTGTAVLRVSCQTQGQGHETTFAQIVAEELGIPPADIKVVHGDTDQTPFGLGTYGSRSTPVSGAAAALVARKVRDKARLIAAGDARGLGRPTSSGTRARFHVDRRPGQRHHHRRHREAGPRRAATCPTASRAGSRRRSATTRRTSPTRTARTSASSTSTPAPPSSRCGGSSRSTTAVSGSTR